MERDIPDSERDRTNRRRFLAAIGGLGVVGLAGCSADGGTDTPTETATPTDTQADTTVPDTTATNTTTVPDGTASPTDTRPTDTAPTETATATPSCGEGFGDDPATLLSLAGGNTAITAGESVTITGEILNSYLFTLDTIEVTLDAPDGWSVSAAGETSFEDVVSQGTRTVEWEVTAPDSGETASVDLTADVSYTRYERCDTGAEASTTTSLFFIAGDISSPVSEGLLAQFDATQLSGDGPVSSWADASGESGATLSQSDANAQPTLQTDAAPTGNAMVRFEADSDFMSTDEPLTTATGDVTMSAAFRINDEANGRQVVMYNGSDTDGNGYGMIVNQEGEMPLDGTIHVLYGGVSWWYSETNLDDDAVHVATMVIPASGEPPALYVDGEDLTPLSTGPGGGGTPGAPTSQFGIGQDEATVDTNPYIDGDIGEELVYEQALSESQRIQLEAYLENRWVSGDGG